MPNTEGPPCAGLSNTYAMLGQSQSRWPGRVRRRQDGLLHDGLSSGRNCWTTPAALRGCLQVAREGNSHRPSVLGGDGR